MCYIKDSHNDNDMTTRIIADTLHWRVIISVRYCKLQKQRKLMIVFMMSLAGARGAVHSVYYPIDGVSFTLLSHHWSFVSQSCSNESPISMSLVGIAWFHPEHMKTPILVLMVLITSLYSHFLQKAWTYCRRRQLFKEIVEWSAPQTLKSIAASFVFTPIIALDVGREGRK